MNNKNFTRREFLNSAALGITFGVQSGLMAAGVSSKKPFNIVQLCDTQLGFGGYEHDLKTFEQAVRQINVLKPDLVFICGDLVNDADEKSFTDFNKTRSKLTVPCHCISGNHDVGNKPTQKSLEYYRKVIGKDYYTFEHKGFVFVIVNTQLWKVNVEGESKKQDLWLQKTLNTASEKVTVHR